MATTVQPTIASTWGLSSTVRRALARLVLDARRDLEDDFRRQLASIGVHPDRLDDVSGRKLAADEEQAREAGIAVIDRVVAAGGSRGEAFETFVRDSAFTFLNRLVGLRCLEERGMLLVGGQRETAIRLDERLRASSLYFRVRNELPADASPRDVWRETLDRAFRAVSERVGLLFDADSEYGRLIPLQPTLTRIVDGLNDPTIPSATWGDDEVLGWVYQYYSSEEKDSVYRKLGRGGKIGRPEELAAASCLYTERYMVDFLLENTLGALWVEMHPETRLPDRWPYYVQTAVRQRGNSENAPRSVRDITLLDPAVGSGHFEARAFDLLVQMYEEEGLEDSAEIPQLILERNLHGIDIDLRAVQITALRLYLKACEIAGPDFRPRRVNFVSADIVLPGSPPAEFLERFSGDREVQDLIEGIWSQLKDAPLLGSLLHPERRVDELLARRRQSGDTLLQQDDRAWERFKLELLDGIREEFEREAESEDIGRRLFGQEAAKGISLVEALVRRYDVVVANPPYGGSRHLDDVLKRFLAREYKDGKPDLYAAFLLRNMEFARADGYVGMVAQQSWLFLTSFAKLRDRVLGRATVTSIAHLGPRAFDEIVGEVVAVALFTLQIQPPKPSDRIAAFRLVGPKSPSEKNGLLRRAVAGEAAGASYLPKQSDLLKIPNTPLVYWAPEAFLKLLASKSLLGSIASVHDGMTTGDNERFLRFFWEVEDPTRWRQYAKAGTYRKWYGLRRYVVDWGNDGRAIKQQQSSFVRNEHRYWTDGLTYNLMSSGAMGARVLSESAFDPSSISIFAREGASKDPEIMVLLNTHISSFLLRLMVQGTKFNGGYVARLPWPSQTEPTTRLLGETCVTLKRLLVDQDVTERGFDPTTFVQADDGRSLDARITKMESQAHDHAALLHALEGWNERLVRDAYGLDDDDLKLVIDETGTPAGWYPLVAGYDELTPVSAGIELPEGFEEHYRGLERREPSSSELTALRRRLKTLYESGAGVAADEDESSANEETALGAHIPIPTETFLEELSVKLGIHPVSIYRLLEDLRENEGLVSPPEIRRVLEDYVSVTLLLLLGYRWPEQDVQEAERGRAVDPELVDPDGIIPLVPCDEHATVTERIRSALEQLFGEEGAARSLEEFRIWASRELDAWLRRDFFRRHIQQFKQRPIAWHLTSREGTFQCLVFYHRLSRDMLRRLRDVYAGALLNRLKAELQRAQSQADADTASELRLQIEDVEDFRDRLLAIEEGRELANRIRCRWKGEEEDGRPGPYAPDVDDGVKVNIRPFQETGLLAREVIKKW